MIYEKFWPRGILFEVGRAKAVQVHLQQFGDFGAQVKMEYQNLYERAAISRRAVFYIVKIDNASNCFHFSIKIVVIKDWHYISRSSENTSFFSWLVSFLLLHDEFWGRDTNFRLNSTSGWYNTNVESIRSGMQDIARCAKACKTKVFLFALIGKCITSLYAKILRILHHVSPRIGPTQVRKCVLRSSLTSLLH